MRGYMKNKYSMPAKEKIMEGAVTEKRSSNSK